jgi:hypothetical protein
MMPIPRVGDRWGHFARGTLRSFAELAGFVADPQVGVGDEAPLSGEAKRR